MHNDLVTESSNEFLLKLISSEWLIFLVSSKLSGVYILSTSSSPRFPELQDEKFNRDNPFKAECSTFSQSLYNVCLCICSSLLEVEASLMI